MMTELDRSVPDTIPYDWIRCGHRVLAILGMKNPSAGTAVDQHDLTHGNTFLTSEGCLTSSAILYS